MSKCQNEKQMQKSISVFILLLGATFLIILVKAKVFGTPSVQEQIEIVNDLKKNNLHGSVKGYSETYYDSVVSFVGIEVGKIKARTEYKFDYRGNQIELNSYNLDGSLFSKFTYKYTYNDQGNCIEKREYDSDGDLNRRFTYKFNDKGNLVEYKVFKYDGG